MAYVKVFFDNRVPHITQVSNCVGHATVSDWALEIGGTGCIYVSDCGLVTPLLKINVRELSRSEFIKLRRSFRIYWSTCSSHHDFKNMVKHPVHVFRPGCDRYDVCNNKSWLLLRSNDCWNRFLYQNVNGFIFDKVGNLLAVPRHYDLKLLNDSEMYLHNIGQHIKASRITHLINGVLYK